MAEEEGMSGASGGENLYEAMETGQTDPFATLPAGTKETINAIVVQAAKRRSAEEQANLRCALLYLLQPSVADKLLSSVAITSVAEMKEKAAGLFSLTKNLTSSGLTAASGLTEQLKGGVLSTANLLGSAAQAAMKGDVQSAATGLGQGALGLGTGLLSTTQGVTGGLGLAGLKGLSNTNEGFKSKLSAEANLNKLIPNPAFREAVLPALRRCVKLREEASKAQDCGKALLLLQARQGEAYIASSLTTQEDKKADLEERERALGEKSMRSPTLIFRPSDFSEAEEWNKLGNPLSTSSSTLGAGLGNIWGKVAAVTKVIEGDNDSVRSARSVYEDMMSVPVEPLATVPATQAKDRTLISAAEIRKLKRAHRRRQRESIGLIRFVLLRFLAWRGLSVEGAGWLLSAFLGAFLLLLLAPLPPPLVLFFLIAAAMAYPALATTSALQKKDRMEYRQWLGYWALGLPVLVGLCLGIALEGWPLTRRLTLQEEESGRIWSRQELSWDGAFLAAYALLGLFYLASPLSRGAEAILRPIPLPWLQDESTLPIKRVKALSFHATSSLSGSGPSLEQDPLTPAISVPSNEQLPPLP